MVIILQVLLVFCLIVLSIAALHDVMARTVPNSLAAAMAIMGLGTQLLQGSALVGVAAAAAVFALAVFCWRRGWMGGGDVKLLGATALMVPPASTPGLIVTISIVGAGLALIYLASRGRMPLATAGRHASLFGRVIRAERWRMRRGGPLPYAVAIAGGAAIVVVNGGML